MRKSQDYPEWTFTRQHLHDPATTPMAIDQTTPMAIDQTTKSTLLLDKTFKKAGFVAHASMLKSQTKG
jgi:hypothetical protein